ncbi:MAG TPA: M20/M25/M40 family metallo-hydrolase [Terriglobales bacterium]|nr:M20/M25/M40 family metallo-hydrolase [Terriglobales bacterium]
MDLFAFTRALIDIESVTGNEAAAAEFVAEFLRGHGFAAELWRFEPGRANVFAAVGKPSVVLSTHLDTVPPFFPSADDGDRIRGRGACDAKGIVAAQLFAALELRAAGASDFGLLFLAGEEKNSAGAKAANEQPCGSRYLINGEPTEGRLVSAGKGVLRVDVRASGRMAHSAYPELGESAIEKLLAALVRLREMPLPADPRLGPTTMNIGTLAGGRAPNVIADEARAELAYRIVAPSQGLRREIERAVAGLAQAEFLLEIPPVFPLILPGYETTTVAFTTDIPALDRWGTPLLLGPGSISLAHTERESIGKAELQRAVRQYVGLVRACQALPAR